MPTDNLQGFKLTNLEGSSSTKQNNMIQAIEDGLNSIEDANVSSGAAIALSKLQAASWTTYTPSWTSTGTAPAIGNGTLSGRRVQIGKLVIGTVNLVAGSTTTFGTGSYRFSLPVTTLATVFPHGIAVGSDTGTNSYVGIASVVGTTVQVLSTASPSVAWGQTVPFTWGNTDELDILFCYEAS